MTDLSERRDQTAFDLKEIKQQLLDGEIDKATYESLKTLYTSERALLKDSPATEEETLPTRSRTRFAVGAAILALAIVAITFAASQFAVDRDGGFITGNDIGEQAPVDLDAVTNEQMIAVIESNQGLPQANGMRLALAERYFEAQEYSEAFGWFDEVLASNPSDFEASEALARTAWMVHASGESDVAISTLDRALELNADNGEARLFRGLIYLQTGRPVEALADLEVVAARSDLTPEILEVVTSLLDQARQEAET